MTEKPSTKKPTPAEEKVSGETDKPKRGRKPNVVGQAAAEFKKAQNRLTRAERRAEKVQDVQDELKAAQEAFEAAKKAYEDAFAASLGDA